MQITGRPPYPPYFHMHYHPDALAIMLMLRGVANPPAFDRCRMLDLGCGTGASLQFYGYDLPNSYFHGVDLDARGIERGRREVAALGLKNVNLECRDATTISESDGKFDFIVAHGFYSWVPDWVRESFWAMASRLLADNGVIYISFNALPGGHLRSVVRDFLLYHHSKGGVSAELTAEVATTLRFLGQMPDEGHLYRQLLKEDAAALLGNRPAQIVFDQLADDYHCFYLHQVLDRAAQSGFQYLSESGWSAMSNAVLPPGVRDMVAGIRHWPARMQYRDFLDGCLFHRTLLCRKEMKLADPSPAVLMRTFIAAPLTIRGKEGDVVEFGGKDNAPIRTNDPLSVAAMTLLAGAFPRQLHFDELFSRAWERSGKCGGEHEARQALAATLMELWGLDSAAFSVHPAHFEKSVSDRPVAHPVGRMRASVGEDPVNALGFLSPSEDLDRNLIQLLDGTRDREELARETGIPRQALESRLETFARLALLVA